MLTSVESRWTIVWFTIALSVVKPMSLIAQGVSVQAVEQYLTGDMVRVWNVANQQQEVSGRRVEKCAPGIRFNDDKTFKTLSCEGKSLFPNSDGQWTVFWQAGSFNVLIGGVNYELPDVADCIIGNCVNNALVFVAVNASSRVTTRLEMVATDYADEKLESIVPRKLSLDSLVNLVLDGKQKMEWIHRGVIPGVGCKENRLAFSEKRTYEKAACQAGPRAVPRENGTWKIIESGGQVLMAFTASGVTTNYYFEFIDKVDKYSGLRRKGFELMKKGKPGEKVYKIEYYNE